MTAEWLCHPSGGTANSRSKRAIHPQCAEPRDNLCAALQLSARPAAAAHSGVSVALELREFLSCVAGVLFLHWNP